METNTVRTQVVLNKEIVEEALQITHLKSKRELLDYALRELIRRETQKKLLELKGKIHCKGDLEALRENWKSFANLPQADEDFLLERPDIFQENSVTF